MLNFWPPSFGYQDTTINVTILEDQTVNGDMAMMTLPSSTISGTVYGPDGNVVEGAPWWRSERPVPEAVTNAAGYYSLSLPSGVGEFYDIVARASGMGAQVQNVELVSDLTLDFNLPEWIGEDFETGNFNNWPWEMAGSADWIIDSSEVYEGTYSARSGNIGHNQSSSMSLTLDVPAPGDINSGTRFPPRPTTTTCSSCSTATWSPNGRAKPAGPSMSTRCPQGPTPSLSGTTRMARSARGSDAGWIDFIEFPPVEFRVCRPSAWTPRPSR